jgi:hypothetical protein
MVRTERQEFSQIKASVLPVTAAVEDLETVLSLSLSLFSRWRTEEENNREMDNNPVGPPRPNREAT